MQKAFRASDYSTKKGGRI